MSTAELWDRFSSTYDKFAEITTYFALHSLELVKDTVLKAQQPVLVLDSASGTGAFALPAAKAFPDAKVLGGDISQQQLNVARQKADAIGGLDNVEFRVMDGQALDVPDSSVDALVCNFGLMFFEDKPKGWSEIYRVLKPGGIAVVATWREPGMLRQFEEAYAKLAGKTDVEELSNFSVARSLRDPELLRSQATAANFAEVSVNDHLFVRKAFPLADAKEHLEDYLKIPMFGDVIPEGRDAEFKTALMEALKPLADDSGIVGLPYDALITVVRK